MKLVIDEAGSDLATELWNTGQPLAASILAYPEGRAALASARRADRLSERTFDNALAEFEQVRYELVAIGVDEILARQAGELADLLGLRGYDAVHLASALALGGDVALISWDADLTAAAKQLGLATAGG